MVWMLQDQIKYEYDSTGIFHWTPHRLIAYEVIYKSFICQEKLQNQNQQNPLKCYCRYIEDVLVTRQEISRSEQ